MPRYFFHCEGTETFVDSVGTELPNERSARVNAVRNAAEVLKDHAERFAGAPRWRVFVTDQDGRTIFALRLSLDEEAPARVVG